MLRSMFAGVSGMRNHQIRLDAIGNNIANVNTVGYKCSRVTFQDTLSQTIRAATAPQRERGGMNAFQIGLGMSVASVDVLHTQGNLQMTGKTTDLAIEGDGFFILGKAPRGITPGPACSPWNATAAWSTPATACYSRVGWLMMKGGSIPTSR